MKTNNIIYMVVFALLIHVGQAHCFFAESVKFLLQATGATCGVLLPMVPTFVSVTPRFAKTYLPLSSRYSQLRNLTDQEEHFYRKYIDTGIEIVCTPQKSNHASSCRNTIIMPEKLTTEVGEFTLIDALGKNNVPVQQLFAGMAEHEAGHIKKKHTLKSSLVCITATGAVTALAALCTSKIMPLTFSDSIVKHVGWCGLKVGTSIFAFAINAYTLSYVFRALGRSQEFEADQNVTEANKKPLMDWLAWADNNDYESLVKKEFNELSEEQQQAKIMELKEKNYASLSCMYPTPEERRKALLKT